MAELTAEEREKRYQESTHGRAMRELREQQERFDATGLPHAHLPGSRHEHAFYEHILKVVHSAGPQIPSRIYSMFWDVPSEYSIDDAPEDEFEAALANYLISNPGELNLPSGYEFYRHSVNTGELRKGNKSWLTFRGTRTAEDVLTDIMLWEEAETNARFSDARELVYDLKSANPTRDYKVTGHSLGGSIADYIASEFDFNGVVFNPYVRVTSNHTKQRVKAIATVDDPASLLYGGDVELYSATKNARSLPLSKRLVEAHKFNQFATRASLEKRLGQSLYKKEPRPSPPLIPEAPVQNTKRSLREIMESNKAKREERKRKRVKNQ